jgi:F-type H+-transporting ATPase subunit b
VLIDWFTVGAQAVNFIILVWLLKRFLYKPILNAVDAREKLIAGKLADADAKEANAQSQRDAFQKKNEAFDKQRAALLATATDEAAAEGRKLLDDARKAADALSAKRNEALRTDAHALTQSLRRRAQQEVFTIAKKTLADLADTDLDKRMAEVFTRRLRGMAGKAKVTFGKALTSSTGPALLRSAFDLPARQRAAIQKALDETFSTKVPIRFETAPSLVSESNWSPTGKRSPGASRTISLHWRRASQRCWTIGTSLHRRQPPGRWPRRRLPARPGRRPHPTPPSARRSGHDARG